jgi:hypothetical protein
MLIFRVAVACVLGSLTASGQQAPSDSTQGEQSKRIFGLVPNYRTTPSLANYQPLTAGEKFKLASDDAFDRGTFALAGIFGAEAQLTNGNRNLVKGEPGSADTSALPMAIL